MPRRRILKKPSRVLRPYGLSLDLQGHFDGHTMGFFTGHDRTLRRATRINEANARAREELARDADLGVHRDLVLEDIVRNQGGKPGWRLSPRVNVDELMDTHRALANRSPFFVKRVSSMEIRVREKLVHAGIAVEEPIQDLGRAEGAEHARLQLFQRAGRMLFTRANKSRIPVSRWDEISSIVLRMHLIGVSHNHLHLGNWILGKRNKLIAIDLEKSRLYSKPVTSKNEFLRRYADDLSYTGLIYWWLRKTDNNPVKAEIMKGIDLQLRDHAKHMPTYNVTSSDVIVFMGS